MIDSTRDAVSRITATKCVSIPAVEGVASKGAWQMESKIIKTLRLADTFVVFFILFDGIETLLSLISMQRHSFLKSIANSWRIQYANSQR